MYIFEKVSFIYIKNEYYFLFLIMFDWYTIKYLFPNAFNKFAEVMFPNVGIESISTLEYFDIKKLYHFFDKEEIGRAHV